MYCAYCQHRYQSSTSGNRRTAPVICSELASLLHSIPEPHSINRRAAPAKRSWLAPPWRTLHMQIRIYTDCTQLMLLLDRYVICHITPLANHLRLRIGGRYSALDSRLIGHDQLCRAEPRRCMYSALYAPVTWLHQISSLHYSTKWMPSTALN